MDVDITQLAFAIAQGAADFWRHSLFVAFVKFLLFVYVSVLLIDIVLLLILRGLSEDLRVTLHGNSRPFMSRNTAITRWEKILERLESDNPSQYKAALLEADAMADGILKEIGFAGETMTERLEKVTGAQIGAKERLAEAHAVRNRVVHEKDFTLTQGETRTLLDHYLAFFQELELF